MTGQARAEAAEVCRSVWHDAMDEVRRAVQAVVDGRRDLAWLQQQVEVLADPGHRSWTFLTVPPGRWRPEPSAPLSDQRLLIEPVGPALLSSSQVWWWVLGYREPGREWIRVQVHRDVLVAAGLVVRRAAPADRAPA